VSQTILDYPRVLRTLRRQHFAVLSTSDTANHPASAGVTYGLTQTGNAMYVMTRRHLLKARNIAANPHVSLVVPIKRRLLWPVPPATIQLRGRAHILDWTDLGGRDVFSRFLLGRLITSSYEKLHSEGERRICFLRIDLDPAINTYMVGTSLWRIHASMKSGTATTVRP
jgi:hypothetical protein